MGSKRHSSLPTIRSVQFGCNVQRGVLYSEQTSVDLTQPKIHREKENSKHRSYVRVQEERKHINLEWDEEMCTDQSKYVPKK